MSFVPPFCPYRDCPRFRDPYPNFFTPHGAYPSRCRSHPVPRFRCKRCKRTFSRQTFRLDFGMKKPHLLAPLLRHLVSGGSLRQAARTFPLARRTVDRALARMGHHAWLFHRNALASLRPRGAFQLDELESYEGDRIFRPLTVATLLQEGSRLLLGFACGTLRSRCSKSEESKALREAYERAHGRRRNESRKVVSKLLAMLKKALLRDPCADAQALVITTDEKKSYPLLLGRVFGERGPRHVRVSSALPRDGRNPLAPINQLEVMTRHHNARLQRETIAASKRRAKLRMQLSLFQLWWNFWRLKTNDADDTPAMAAGIVERRARFSELVAWRQDFGVGKLPLLAKERAA